MKIPLLSDLTKKISSDYGVLLESAGIALRWSVMFTSLPEVKNILVSKYPFGIRL